MIPSDHISTAFLIGFCLRLLDNLSGAINSKVPELELSISNYFVTSPKSPKTNVPTIVR
jgi:hypothetical protein